VNKKLNNAARFFAFLWLIAPVAVPTRINILLSTNRTRNNLILVGLHEESSPKGIRKARTIAPAIEKKSAKTPELDFFSLLEIMTTVFYRGTINISKINA